MASSLRSFLILMMTRYSALALHQCRTEPRIRTFERSFVKWSAGWIVLALMLTWYHIEVAKWC